MNKYNPVIAVVAFVAAYAVVYEATNWGAVYLLDWWDPKFGNQRGNIAFGREIMPLFVIVSVVSFLSGAAIHWRWMVAAQPREVAWSSAAVGVISHWVLAALAILTRDAHGGFWMTIVAWALLLGGPAATAVITFNRISRQTT